MSSPDKATSPDDELDRKVSEYVRIGLPIAIVVLVVLSGLFIDAPTALLVAAAGALIAVIAVFWSSLRTLLGETPLSAADAYVFGAPPRIEEEQKRSVMRALKDIEFERSVGKISEEDYQQLRHKYRTEAKRLLQTIDEKSAEGRQRAEVLVQKKLRQAGLVEGSAPEVNAPDDGDEVVTELGEKPLEDAASMESAVAAVAMIAATKRPTKKKKAKKKRPAFESIDESVETNDESVETNACSKCNTANDKDAVFCKKCGTRVGKPEEAPSESENKNQSETDEEDAS